MYNTLNSGPIVMELEFSRQLFEKYSHIKFQALPVGAKLFHGDRRTDMMIFTEAIPLRGNYNYI